MFPKRSEETRQDMGSRWAWYGFLAIIPVIAYLIHNGY